MERYSIFAAWWGALIASIVLLFDFYKWARSGPRLLCDVKYGWKIKAADFTDDNEYIFFSVSNTGDRPTTIIHQAAIHWPTILDRILKKHETSFFIKGGAYDMGKIPAIIRPGEIWNGISRIDDKIRSLVDNGGQSYLVLSFSHRKRSYFFPITKVKRKLKVFKSQLIQNPV